REATAAVTRNRDFCMGFLSERCKLFLISYKSRKKESKQTMHGTIGWYRNCCLKSTLVAILLLCALPVWAADGVSRVMAVPTAKRCNWRMGGQCALPQSKLRTAPEARMRRMNYWRDRHMS